MRINSSPFANFPPQESVLTGNTLFIHSSKNNTLQVNASLIYLGSNLPVTRAVYSAIKGSESIKDKPDDLTDDQLAPIVANAKPSTDYKEQKYFEGNTAVAVWQAIKEGDNTPSNVIQQYELGDVTFPPDRGYPKSFIIKNDNNTYLNPLSSENFDPTIYTKLTINSTD